MNDDERKEGEASASEVVEDVSEEMLGEEDAAPLEMQEDDDETEKEYDEEEPESQ